MRQNLAHFAAAPHKLHRHLALMCCAPDLFVREIGKFSDDVLGVRDNSRLCDGLAGVGRRAGSPSCGRHYRARALPTRAVLSSIALNHEGDWPPNTPLHPVSASSAHAHPTISFKEPSTRLRAQRPIRRVPKHRFRDRGSSRPRSGGHPCGDAKEWHLASPVGPIGVAEINFE
jgi:hypothetical protein